MKWIINANSIIWNVQSTHKPLPPPLPLLLLLLLLHFYHTTKQNKIQKWPNINTTVQLSRSTRSSTLVTLLQPSDDSSLNIINHSFWHAAPHMWNNLPPTLCVPYQSGSLSPPSSSPLSFSDPEPLIDVSHGIFHFFFPSTAIYPLLRLISWSFTTRCFDSHWWRNIGQCGRLSKPSSFQLGTIV